MNKQLIKFIELCLADGMISDKERKVIFRKAKELGVPKDECEIILDGLVLKNAKENNKQEEIIHTRKPVKKEVEDKQKNAEKAKRIFSLSEIKIPAVIRVMLTLVLSFGYFFFGIILVSSSGPIIWGFLTILAYFIFRFFKLQEEYFYFTISIFIIYFISKGDDYFIGSNFHFIFVGILLPYIIILLARTKNKKGINKDIEKLEKRKYENSKTKTETKEPKKIVNKDIEKFEKRRGRKD